MLYDHWLLSPSGASRLREPGPICKPAVPGPPQSGQTGSQKTGQLQKVSVLLPSLSSLL